MSEMEFRNTLLEDQLRLRDQPKGRPVISMSWSSLLFIHYPCDVAEVAPLIPPGLTLETWPDENGVERAWIGLVPFLMEEVRPNGAPRALALRPFPETNVRTYVHANGRDPGVWFFSLDAGSRIACSVARATFGLPYFESSMSVSRNTDSVNYASKRISRGLATEISAEFAEPIGLAKPGSFEFWLVERYILYSLFKGRLNRGHVHHAPYQLRKAEVSTLQDSLVSAAGIHPLPGMHHVACDQVNVKGFQVQPVGGLET